MTNFKQYDMYMYQGIIVYVHSAFKTIRMNEYVEIMLKVIEEYFTTKDTEHTSILEYFYEHDQIKQMQESVLKVKLSDMNCGSFSFILDLIFYIRFERND
jgi:hypothetical protein